MVIIEYVPYGDLLGYLRKSRGLNDTYYKDLDVKPKTNLTSQQLMKFAWQVADGMSFLSSKNVSTAFFIYCLDCILSTCSVIWDARKYKYYIHNAKLKVCIVF